MPPLSKMPGSLCAIRLASPGGLGRFDAQDVAGEPDVTLLELHAAGGRTGDGIAREYVTAFEMTFETGVPVLDQARRDGLPWNEAVGETFLSVLAAAPDTHMARSAGDAAQSKCPARARRALAAGGSARRRAAGD